MTNFDQEYRGVPFCGRVLDHGPYPPRLVVFVDPSVTQEELLGDWCDWPSDDWVSEATRESVMHWTLEGHEEIYLPETANIDKAETLRRGLG